MKTLGVGSSLFRGLACSIPFTVLPFVDTTGRHTVSGNVTLNNGRGVFSGVAGQQLVMTNNTKDFSLATRPDVSVTVNPQNFGGDRLIWALYNNETDSENMEFYHKSDGRLILNFGAPSAGVIDTFSQTGYVLSLNTDTVLRVVQEAVTVWSVYAGGVLRGTIVGITPRTKIPRKLTLGGYPLQGLRFVGEMDDFSWTNT